MKRRIYPFPLFEKEKYQNVDSLLCFVAFLFLLFVFSFVFFTRKEVKRALSG
jgi:hypothetical protein